MSTLAEIQSALPRLTLAELRHVEEEVHRLQTRDAGRIVQSENARVAALDALQASLRLDAHRAAEWTQVIRAARR